MSRFISDFFILSLLIIVVICGSALTKVMARRGTLTEMQIGETKFSVETAKTPLQIEKGLGNRKRVTGDGMLFYFAEPVKPFFWMKGMQFALDFVWINGDKVVDLTEHVPAPPANTPEHQLQTYSPKENVTHVLELPAGTVAQKKIMIGDSVKLQ